VSAIARGGAGAASGGAGAARGGAGQQVEVRQPSKKTKKERLLNIYHGCFGSW
jgi:hypothetical protein